MSNEQLDSGAATQVDQLKILAIYNTIVKNVLSNNAQLKQIWDKTTQCVNEHLQEKLGLNNSIGVTEIHELQLFFSQLIEKKFSNKQHIQKLSTRILHKTVDALIKHIDAQIEHLLTSERSYALTEISWAESGASSFRSHK